MTSGTTCASARWLEQGHEEGLADRAGEAYHAWIAIPAVAVLNVAKAAASRPFVASWAAVVTLPALFFVLRVAGVSGQVAAVVCGARSSPRSPMWA